jgi:hypothetical protein
VILLSRIDAPAFFGQAIGKRAFVGLEGIPWIVDARGKVSLERARVEGKVEVEVEVRGSGGVGEFDVDDDRLGGTLLGVVEGGFDEVVRCS